MVVTNFPNESLKPAAYARDTCEDIKRLMVLN